MYVEYALTAKIGFLANNDQAKGLKNIKWRLV